MFSNVIVSIADTIAASNAAAASEGAERSPLA
jgi:hypothetical protein